MIVPTKPFNEHIQLYRDPYTLGKQWAAILVSPEIASPLRLRCNITLLILLLLCVLANAGYGDGAAVGGAHSLLLAPLPCPRGPCPCWVRQRIPAGVGLPRGNSPPPRWQC